MSLTLAIDPNVLLAAAQEERRSVWALEGIAERCNEISIGLDPENQIYVAYEEYRHQLEAHECTRAFFKLFFDRRGVRRCVTIQQAILSQEECNWLDQQGCSQPVEPELIAVGKAAPRNSAVLVIGEPYEGLGIRKRGTERQDVIDTLHAQYSDLDVWPVAEMGKRLERFGRSRYPGNEQELVLFIDTGRQEYEYVEYKQPGREVNGRQIETTELTSSIIIASLQEACAMLNADGGCVLIGVNSVGQIRGIDSPRRNAKGEPDDDYLSRTLSDEFGRFNPPANQFLKPAIIPLDSGRRVVVLHVFADERNRRYSFDDGHELAVWDRCGSSMRKSQVIGRSQYGRRHRR